MHLNKKANKPLLEEQVFIEQLKNGHERAYSELISKFEQKVFSTCMSFVPNVADAENIAQDVFVEVFNSIHKFKGDSKLSTWIYRITTNKCLEFIRKKKTKKRFGFLQALFSEDFSIDNTNYHTELNHPGVLMEQQELSETVYKAISLLPEQQSLVFTLHKLDGKSYKEISEILEKSINSVESLMHRAKQNLKQTLEHYYKNNY